MSTSFITKYMNKRGVVGPWEIKPKPQKSFSQIIVIPSYAESDFINKTLNSINNNDIDYLKSTLVIIVINNSTKSDDSIRINNQHTFDKIRLKNFNFSFGIIDAFNKGFEISEKYAGVGYARKIGIDLALNYIESSNTIIFCIDADTLVNKNYIKIVVDYFKYKQCKAAVVNFCHLYSTNLLEQKAIIEYENFLKYTAKSLRKAGSPYGYVAMGSTMICTVQAYCAIGGMSKKKATEDFYFLQELSKYSGIKRISQKLVYPSSRRDYRVYLGTGFRINQILNGFKIDNLYYSERSFTLLSSWLQLATNSSNLLLHDLIKKINSIDNQLYVFLKNQGLEKIWNNLQKNTKSTFHFRAQFHRWFDGLKTLRFLKYFT